MAQRTYPSYWLYKDNRGEWRWSYDAKNGETIAVSSEGYNRRIDAQRGIAQQFYMVSRRLGERSLTTRAAFVRPLPSQYPHSHVRVKCQNLSSN